MRPPAASGARPGWRRQGLRRIAAGAAVLALAAGAAAQNGAYARHAGDLIVLGNRYLQRDIAVENGVVGTVAIHNQLTHRVYAFSGGEFQLRLIRERVGYWWGGQNPWVLTARDFSAGPPVITAEPGGGQQVTFRLRLRQPATPGLTVALHYALRPGEFYTRQWLVLKTRGVGTYFMDWVAPFRDQAGTGPFRLGGFGQPLYTNDLFFGLAYPTADNRATPISGGERVTLGRVVGEDIPAAGYRTQPAVIGVAPEGGVHAQFLHYVNRIRVAAVRPYLLYNTWFDMPSTRMTEAKLLRRVAQFQAEMARYHLRLDAFVLDDGWDDFDHLWRVDRRRFPGGFQPLVHALAGLPSHLGLWFGPIGGYGHRELRLATARKMGMEITTNGQYLCLAGRKYRAYFQATLLRDERQFGVNYFKLDGIPFGCNDPHHGHPVGIYSREADMRAFTGLVAALRRQNPKVFINATTSTWLSPWWLKYADTVWMGGDDSGYLASVPALQPRQSAISYRDAVLYQDFVVHQAQFPMSSIMTHGIIRGRYNLLGGKDEPLADWDDAIVHYFSVGNMMYGLYITPSLLSRAEWNALAGGIHWAEANAHPLLDNSTMVLGDPARRQVYGFVHAAPDQTFITLRNPFVQARNVSLPLTAANGFVATAQPLDATVIYPYRRDLPGSLQFGGTLRLRLGAYEQEVIALRPAAGRRLRVLGARYAWDHGQLHLYAPNGATRTVALAGASRRQATVHFGAARQTAPLWMSAPAFNVAPDGATGITAQIRLPSDVTRARLAVLLQPPAPAAGVTATARVNGRAAAVGAINPGQGQWYWFRLPLAAGRSRIRISLGSPAGLPPGSRLAVYFLAERQLAEKTIAVQLTPGVAPPAPDLLPARTATRSISHLLGARVL